MEGLKLRGLRNGDKTKDRGSDQPLIAEALPSTGHFLFSGCLHPFHLLPLPKWRVTRSESLLLPFQYSFRTSCFRTRAPIPRFHWKIGISTSVAARFPAEGK